MAYLILIRHGITNWNVEGRWQGLTDTSINEGGKIQAKQAAQALNGIRVDIAFTSNLIRTKQTSEEICKTSGYTCPVFSNAALNERDYGIYTGKNKWQVKKKLGEKEFQNLRRGWDYPIPKGESLKDVYGRVIPFYQQEILGKLKQGKNIMIVSSGNTLRALIKYLDNYTDQEILNLELNFAEVRIYNINNKGEVINREIKT